MTQSIPQTLPDPVHWRAVLDPEQVPHQPKERLHVVGFRAERAAKSWIAEQLDFGSWRYTLEPLYAAAHPLVGVIPEGMALVPIEPTTAMISAMSCSKARDAEGEFPALMDLIDYSGENKTHAVLRAAYAAMLEITPSRGDASQEAARGPLTKERIDDLSAACWSDLDREIEDFPVSFARAIEAAHGIGTPPQGVDHG
jgi:hypothetical protein